MTVEKQPATDRYAPLEQLGEGAFFIVHKARDTASGHIVAIESLRPEYATSSEFTKALRLGLSAASVLSHHDIARIYEVDSDGAGLRVIVEYARGVNLKDRIRRVAPFATAIAVDFGCMVGEALQHAHRAGQVHGGLRPQNIIVSPEGDLKITGFGVQPAVVVSAEAQRASLEDAADYLAPELSIARPGTEAGDLYAVGAILYEMLTGTPPFAGGAPEAIAERQASDEIPSARAVNPNVPPALEGIIRKCLQKAPERRYATASAMVVDMHSVRDALRFGKSVSWWPADTETSAAGPGITQERSADSTGDGQQAAARALPAAAATTAVLEPPTPARQLEMTNANRLRAEDARLSGALKVAIGVVTTVILLALILIGAIWWSDWVTPAPVTVPQLTGKSISDVRAMAAKMRVRLIEHGDYTDKPRDVVYKTDLDPGEQIRAGHYINVWYSKGPAYVNVPDVRSLPKDIAQQKLHDAGLTLGKVSTDYSDRTPENSVIRQDVSSQKRVLHDTVVDLVVSAGPRPEQASAANPPGDQASDQQAPDTGDVNGETDNTASEQTTNSAPHVFDRAITIPVDGRGDRQVRIEYTDAMSNTPIPVIDELHSEGDKIPVTFTYYGNLITLRIYYDGRLAWERTFDPIGTAHEQVR